MAAAAAAEAVSSGGRDPDADTRSIESLVRRRHEHRGARKWDEADAIRLLLLQRGVVCVDGHGEDPKWMKVGRDDAQHGACMVWSHRKLAFCDSPKEEGQWFCSSCCESKKLRGRVPCPIDPRHHLKPAKVRAHLGVCQSRPGVTALMPSCSHERLASADKTRKDRPAYHVSGANRPEHGQSGSIEIPPAVPARDAATAARQSSDLNSLCRIEKKVDAALRTLGVLISGEDESSSDKSTNSHSKMNVAPLPREFAPSGNTALPKVGVKRRREMPQHASIVNHLLKASCLDATTSLCQEKIAAIECCAGRGRLSLALQKCIYELEGADSPQTHSCPSTQFILIDRATRRRRADASIKIQQHSTVERITMDISDLFLPGLPAVESADHVLVYGKHLCGAASDVSLMACHKLLQNQNVKSTGAEERKMSHIDFGSSKKPATTVCFALCCHHLCEWDSLVGRDVLTAAGISREDFSLMRRLCTFYRKEPKQIKSSGITSSAMIATKRAHLGVKIKRLINECRAKFMRESGDWNGGVRVVQYVDEETTPENQLLVASTVEPHTGANLFNGRQRHQRHRKCKTGHTGFAYHPHASSLLSVFFSLACMLVYSAFVTQTFFPPTANALSSTGQTFVEDETLPPIPPAAPPDRPMPRKETGVDGIGVDIAVGMTVVRGPDWQYGRQDGYSEMTFPSQKKLSESRDTWERMPRGTVVEVRQWITSYENGTRTENGTTSGTPVTVPGSVRVHWHQKVRGSDSTHPERTSPDSHSGGGVNVYRYGAEGKYDVRVVDQGISPVDWESVIQHMPDRNYELAGSSGTKRVNVNGFSSGGRSYHDRVVTHQADRDALRAIYRAAGGPRWSSARGWRQGCDEKFNETMAQKTDPCRDGWIGVTCDHTVSGFKPGTPARIFALDLSNNRLIGTIAPEIGNMTHLRTLTMANNALHGKLPRSLSRCTELEYLSLEVNRLEGTVPKAYGGLNELKWLSLYNNRLAGHFPSEVSRLPSLTHVFLQQNRFTGPRPALVSKNIQKFQIHGNQWGLQSSDL